MIHETVTNHLSIQSAHMLYVISSYCITHTAAYLSRIGINNKPQFRRMKHTNSKLYIGTFSGTFERMILETCLSKIILKLNGSLIAA
jgi:hypothetical protein